MAPFRSGFVAIVGLPNVGKSTLMNCLLGQKIAITSAKPQTTRNRILGVKNVEHGQLVLVDTPGLHRARGKGRSELNRYMVEQALAAIAEVDVVLVIIDLPEGPGLTHLEEGSAVIGPRYDALRHALAKTKQPVVLAVNKIDRLRRKDLLLPLLDAWGKVHPFAAMLPIAAATGEGVEPLTELLWSLLPEGERLFPEEMITDRAERWLAAEMVREQVFHLTREEIPYAVAVAIDTFTERGKDVVIEATIHVEKEAQKRILVGEGGRMIREIGSRARREIGELLSCPVHLHLFVKVNPEWSQDPQRLRDLGYE